MGRPQVGRDLGERHPEAPLELRAVVAAEAAAAVRTGTVDAACSPPADTSDWPSSRSTRRSRWPWCPPITFSARPTITAADLDGEPILVPLDDVGWADRPGAAVDHRPETTSEAIELVAVGS